MWKCNSPSVCTGKSFWQAPKKLMVSGSFWSATLLLKSAHVIPRIVDCVDGCWIWSKASCFVTTQDVRYGRFWENSPKKMRLNKRSPRNSLESDENTLQKTVWIAKMTPPPREGDYFSSRNLAGTFPKHCEYHAMSSEPGEKKCFFSGVATAAVALF